MRIFVTGAPGFIGSALVPKLMQAGHHVLGLTRSEAGAEALRAAGADVKYGNIDVERLYHLAFEKAEPGAIYHAVDEEGVSMKAIAEALGRGLKVPVVSIKPEEAEAHFGWLARFAGHDMPASSALTEQKLNWKPTGPSLIADLDGMDYTQA
jgi:nucleoside-diphosphate-sugar epimerase